MKKQHLFFLAFNAIIAAVYVALTYAFSFAAYGEIQFRIAEILIFLALFDVRFLPGLIVGCFLANILSPNGWMDLLFGTAATVIAVTLIFFTGKTTRQRDPAAPEGVKLIGFLLVPVIGALANGFLVALLLKLVANAPYWLTVLTVGIGEFAVLVLGGILFWFLKKIPAVQRVLFWCY